MFNLKKALSICIVTCLTLLVNLSYAATAGGMVGSWHKLGNDDGEISLIVIEGDEASGYTLQTFGRCPPANWCNQAKVKAEVSLTGIHWNWAAGARIKESDQSFSSITLLWTQNSETVKRPTARTHRWHDQNRIEMGFFSKSTNDFPYGLKTCKAGYVWREAVPNDHVCVLPAQRTQANRDNNLHKQNSKNNLGGCPRGLVQRNASFTDTVCVSPRVKTQMIKDNAAQNERWLEPDFNWP